MRVGIMKASQTEFANALRWSLAVSGLLRLRPSAKSHGFHALMVRRQQEWHPARGTLPVITGAGAKEIHRKFAMVSS